MKHPAGAVQVLQAITNLTNPIKVDGKVGPATRNAVAALGSTQRKQLDDSLVKLGLPSSSSMMTVAVPDTFGFNAVVEAVSREARKRKLDPTFFIAQIAFETGWGRSVPKLPNGQSSYNYAGLKYESVKSQVKGQTNVQTLEYIKNVPQQVRDSFAVFNGVADFARVYFWYLLEGPSSYRYPGLVGAKTALQFGEILQKGGYATDPMYAQQLASVQRSVVSRFGDVINNIA